MRNGAALPGIAAVVCLGFSGLPADQKLGRQEATDFVITRSNLAALARLDGPLAAR